jgi:hypothetical protein
MMAAPTPQPATAAPLGALDLPYEEGDQAVLQGDRSALDLKTLTRTTLDYSLTGDTRALTSNDVQQATALRAHLAADPRWRVYQEGETVVAARRVLDDQGWSVAATGYHPDAAGAWRVLARFGPWPADHPWRTSSFVSRAAAGSPEIELNGFVPSSTVWEGRVISALTLDGPQVSVDVYETGSGDARDHTAKALEELPSLLHNAGMLKDRLLRHGHEPMLLPPGEPGNRGPLVEVTGHGAGWLDWQARVNPGEPGWVWLRLLENGRPFDDVAVVAGTREAIGWSTAPEQTFYAQSRFSVAPGPAFAGVAEVWFLPERGDARVLLRKSLTVPAR